MNKSTQDTFTNKTDMEILFDVNSLDIHLDKSSLELVVW